LKPARRLASNLMPQQCTAAQLRDKAAHCFRMARATPDKALAEQLRRIGVEFEKRATALEAEF
jgi:hypothetical protein